MHAVVRSFLEGGIFFMIRIKENLLDNRNIIIEVDGVLDHGAIPVLKSVCERHLERDMKILLNLAGIVHITRAGRTFLRGLRKKISLSNLPEFMTVENGLH